MANRFHTAPKRHTTAAGYGYQHQQERKRRLPLYNERTPCFAGCGRPLGPDRSEWHLPHNPARTGYLPGFWCADCNRRDGARRGNARQRARRQGTRRAQSRAW